MRPPLTALPSLPQALPLLTGQPFVSLRLPRLTPPVFCPACALSVTENPGTVIEAASVSTDPVTRVWCFRFVLRCDCTLPHIPHTPHLPHTPRRVAVQYAVNDQDYHTLSPSHPLVAFTRV